MTVTLDTNLFIDLAESRTDAKTINKVLDLAREGILKLYYTAMTDFETDYPGAIATIIRLVREGILHEVPNTGTGRDYMPGSPGLHRVEDKDIDALTKKIWPNACVLKLSYENKRKDVCHLLAHKLNKLGFFTTRDSEILSKRLIITEILSVEILSPEEVLLKASA